MAVAIPARGMLCEYGDREDPSTRGKKAGMYGRASGKKIIKEIKK